MQYTSGDRVVQLTAELRNMQALLSERQRELLHAIAAEGPGEDVLRRQVRALSYGAMGIIGEIEKELQRRRSGAEMAGGRAANREAESVR